jgi:hypothetical protein
LGTWVAQACTLVHTKSLGNMLMRTNFEKKICEVERTSRHSSYLGEEGGGSLHKANKVSKCCGCCDNNKGWVRKWSLVVPLCLLTQPRAVA